ncbi:MAG: SDR family oxidoreductase [Candidatus Firestonebacteria bacterium]|nr:SDR family oxidoreductase [Candidatus Firestonebacteria bacterium]
MATKSKFLITGSTGTLGSEIRKRLAAKKTPFRALVHSSEKAAQIAGPGVETVVGDFDKPETLKPALEGMEKVFLLSSSDLKQVERESVLADLAKAAGVRHVIKLSMMGAALDSAVSLARWHAQIERHIEGTGMKFTHLRPNYYMQNFLPSAQGILTRGVFSGSLGGARISMIDAADIAGVAVRCLTHAGYENMVYELTGPEALGLSDVAVQLSRVLKRPISYVNVPLETSRKSMLSGGMPVWYVDALQDLMRSFLEGFGSRVTLAVADITGRSATSFHEFAHRFAELDAHRENKAA